MTRSPDSWSPHSPAAGTSFADGVAGRGPEGPSTTPGEGRSQRRRRLHARHLVARLVAFGGTPNYPKGFKNFDWVNPDAPKGGTLYLGNPDRCTS